MMLMERLKLKADYLENEQYLKYIDTLEKTLNLPLYRSLLEYDMFSGKKLECLREAISETVLGTPFDNQLDCVQAINEFFGDQETDEACWREEYIRGETTIRSDRICRIDKLLDPIAIKIWLLKYLHGGENPDENYSHHREDIAAKFNISPNTLNKYLDELRYGCNILGSEVKISLRRGSNNYDSTVHPVFLALNLSEVYLLTVLLRQALGESASNVVADIYRQLSPYAKEVIDNCAQRDGVDLLSLQGLKVHKVGYRTEIKEDILYFLKSGEPLRLGLKNEIPKTHIGYVKIVDKGLLFIDKETKETINLDIRESDINSITKA